MGRLLERDLEDGLERRVAWLEPLFFVVMAMLALGTVLVVLWPMYDLIGATE
ncbi:MAG: hypothetical protein AB1758_32285 [Candidatus Eremiobacterota bacterium]